MGYNYNEIKKWYEKGKELGATHLLILLDKEDGMLFNKYILEGQNIHDAMKNVYRYQKKENIIIKDNIDLNKSLDEHIYKSLCDKAYKYASKKHKGKYRKGYVKKPYIVHPINVSNLVQKYMKNDEELMKYKIVSLLHDTLEDSDATYEEEAKLFGKEIADIVLELSSDKTKQKELGKDVYLSNKMLEMKDKTLIIKLCDRLDNVAGLDEVDDAFNEKYIRETIYIINYLLLYRELNNTHLHIINDIMKRIKEVSIKDPMIIKPRKLTFENKK